VSGLSALLILGGCDSLTDADTTFQGAGSGNVPRPPTGLSPDGVSIVSPIVEMTCDRIDGVREYQFHVTYHNGPNVDDFGTYSSSTCSQKIIPTSNHTTHYFRIRARNPDGWGEWSEWASFHWEGGEPPRAPTGLSPTGESIRETMVTMSCRNMDRVLGYEFDVDYHNGSAVVDYETYRATSCRKTLKPTTRNTRYHFRIRARNENGSGEWSEWSSFYYEGYDPGGPPPAPVGLYPSGQSISGSTVTMSCNAIDGVRQYEFEVDYFNGPNLVDYATYLTSECSKTITPSKSDTKYYFRIRASNDYGKGEWSEWSNFYFEGGGPGGDPPPPPVGLRPTGESFSDPSVTMTCTAVNGAVEYEFDVDYFNSGGNLVDYQTYRSPTCSQTVWPTARFTRYYFRIRARNAYGWGGWSESSSFYFEGVDPPPPPTGLTPHATTITTESVTLRCNAITGVSQYEFWVEVWVGSGYQYYYTWEGGTNSRTFWPQTPNTDYRWRVRAKNSGGWGDWSNWAVFFFWRP
jgi:hypothetical protein